MGSKTYLVDQEKLIQIDTKNKAKQKSSQEVLDALNRDLSLWSKMNMLIGDAMGKKVLQLSTGLNIEAIIGIR